MKDINVALLIGAVLDFSAGFLHVFIVFGGVRWYEFFGAGDRFVRAVMDRRIYPVVVTLFISSVLMTFSVYALSGAGLIFRLPLLREVLLGIASVYLVRSLLGPIMLIRSHGRKFVLYTSLVCMVFGAFHLIGVFQIWSKLG